jgi:hypothetical protein
VRAAELTRDAAGSSAPIDTPGGDLPPGANETYEALLTPPWLGFEPRGLEEGIRLYVDWLRRHPAAQSRA